MNCPVCGGSGPHALTDTWLDPVANAPYNIFLCSGCGVSFADPFKNPGADWYSRFSTAASYEEIAKHQFKELLRGRNGSGKRLLDIGCGNGVFLAMAERAGFEVFGIDINPEAVNRARARGLRNIFLGDLRAFRGNFPELKFDVVTYFDCIEHLDDPNTEMDSILEVLTPSGLLALNTPNNDRPLPFGRDAFDMPPHHLTRWTRRSLSLFLERHGLEIQKLDSDHLPVWEFSRHFINRLRELAMKAARRLLLPDATPPSATFTQVMAASPAGAAGFLASAKSRQKLVKTFHNVLYVLTFPVFFWVMLYYRLTRPGSGTQLFVTAARRGR